MLALVWATRYFRCYLYGKRFLVRTDHAALTYLQKFADHNSRLLRLSLKLSELDFVVEHRAGSKIGHADALSRHVGAITNPDPLSRESIQQEQSKDAFCRRENPGTCNCKSEYFLNSDDVMNRRQQNGKHQLVVPQTLIQDVIRENHDPKYMEHPGIKGTYSLISLNYWWPKMRETIQQYVRCDPCQRRKESREMIAPFGDVEEPTFPFEVTSMDITGPYPTTPRGNKYLLTVIGPLRKCVETFPIPDHRAETYARVYSSQIVTPHGSRFDLVHEPKQRICHLSSKERAKY